MSSMTFLLVNTGRKSPSNFLAEFAEIFSYSVGRPLIFERQDNSNGLIWWDLVLWFGLILISEKGNLCKGDSLKGVISKTENL